jgi:DNA-binding CsgD family transcriptional regulator
MSRATLGGGVRFTVTLTGILAVQAMCTVFFVSDILLGIFGPAPGSAGWQLRDIAQIAAACGLVLGVVLGAIALQRQRTMNRKMEAQIRAASSAFHSLMHERFDDWGLTPAERDVAVFALKGLTLAEIAGLRSTSEGTVKAQTAAIYRKAGVSGRAQLLSLFLDDLMDDGLARPEAP